MASSRKRPPKPDPADRALLSSLAATVQRAAASASAPAHNASRAVGVDAATHFAVDPAIQSAVDFAVHPAADCADAGTAAAAAKGSAHPPLLVAYSGGPDSTVLLDLACALRDAHAPGFAQLHAVHVHHGLQSAADSWVEHCARECAQRDVGLTVCRVRVDARRGVEAAARDARYEALLRVALERGASYILTAHHADDRIETFLLQWLRGAGPAGLAGIASQRANGPAPVRILRPLLEFTRAQLEEYCARHRLAVVEDPSNADPRFARNALRLHVLPPLARIRAGYRKGALRSIDLMCEAADLLQELASEGLAHCTQDAPAGMLRIDRLGQLAPVRRPLVLRAWLAQAGVESPSRARLREALDQALGEGRDGRMLIRIGARELRLYRGLLCLRRPRAAARVREELVWRGEEELVVGSWGGVLRFLPAQGEGFDPDWLRELPLEVRARTGGERFKPHATRPSKRLKHLYQEAGVPEFERGALPLVWRDDCLIYVARLGADARLVERGGPRVRLEWHGDATLLSLLPAN